MDLEISAPGELDVGSASCLSLFLPTRFLIPPLEPVAAVPGPAEMPLAGGELPQEAAAAVRWVSGQSVACVHSRLTP